MADQTLHSMTQDTNPTTTSELYLLEDPAGSPLNRRITAAHLLRVTNNLTADATPDRTADYVATWDNSASDMKKVLLANVSGYAISFGVTEDSNPADATTYYFGLSKGLTTSANTRYIYIPRTGTVRAINISGSLTAGSSETSTISFRLNNTTDTTIFASVNLSGGTTDITNTALGISVVTGDTFEIKWATPTWVTTNPTNLAWRGVVWIA